MIKWNPTAIDRFLQRIFDWDVISETDCEGWKLTGHSQNADGYLARYFIWNNNKGEVKKPHIYLHHILKSDPDREHHDHPWDFYSLILAGGYWEETPVSVEEMHRKHRWYHVTPTGEYVFPNGKTVLIKYDESTYAMRRWYGPGSFLRRPAEWTHRLYLEKPAWTLVYTKKKRRDWGFHSRFGWIFWKNFLSYKCEGTIDGEGNKLTINADK